MIHPTRHRPVRRALPTAAVLLAAALAPPLAAQEAAAPAAPTAEELIARNLEAKGGREKLEAIDTARVTGRMSMGTMEAPFVLEWKSPDKMRMEMNIQGMTFVQGFDGESGWMINPFLGKATPEKLSGEEAEMAEDQADFHGPLFHAAERGYAVEYLGETEVEGTPTYELKVTKPSGEEVHVFLDREYYLEIQQTSKRTVRGQQVETEVAIGDYKEVDGVLMAHSLEGAASGGHGPGGGFQMTVETTELNPEIAEERFVMPAAPSAAEEGGGGEGEGFAR